METLQVGSSPLDREVLPKFLVSFQNTAWTRDWQWIKESISKQWFKKVDSRFIILKKFLSACFLYFHYFETKSKKVVSTFRNNLQGKWNKCFETVDSLPISGLNKCWNLLKLVELKLVELTYPWQKGGKLYPKGYWSIVKLFFVCLNGNSGSIPRHIQNNPG